ncbi:MAG: STM3941 family protein [Ginsengibacter sp.]
MNSASPIIVNYSPKKRKTLIILSAFLLITGVAILIKAFSSKPFTHSFIMPIGIVCLLGFMAVVIYARRLFVNNTVMVIDEKGVMDNSNSGSIGFFPWDDVADITKKKVAGRKFICVMMKNPNEYLKKGTSLLQQKRIEFNNSYCDTPIVISSKGLSMDHYTLLEVLQRKLKLYHELEDSRLNDASVSS